MFAWFVSQSASSVFLSHQISTNYQLPASQQYFSPITNQQQPPATAKRVRVSMMDIMLLCFNSIKVKVFYALECCNTASPEKKKLSKKDGHRGLKWARVQSLLHAAAVFFQSYMGRVSRVTNRVASAPPVCSQSVSSLVVASDESTRRRRQRQSRVRRRRRARRAGSHGAAQHCPAASDIYSNERLPQIASPPRRVDHLHHSGGLQVCRQISLQLLPSDDRLSCSYV